MNKTVKKKLIEKTIKSLESQIELSRKYDDLYLNNSHKRIIQNIKELNSIGKWIELDRQLLKEQRKLSSH